MYLKDIFKILVCLFYVCAPLVDIAPPMYYLCHVQTERGMQ